MGTKNPDNVSGFLVSIKILMQFYCNTKTIGMLNETLTGLPRC